jgi:hypothetical protein
MERMIRLSPETVALLRGIEHNGYASPEHGASEAEHCLSFPLPIYSMCGGMLMSGQDILANAEECDPYADRVASDTSEGWAEEVGYREHDADRRERDSL